MAEDAEDLQSLGLVAHSYDGLFGIRKRIRKISDLTIPLRNGISVPQVGIGIVVFLISVVVLGLVINPVLTLAGPGPQWQVTVLVIFGPAVLAAQRITKPMSYGKSIGSSFESFLRFHLDDRLHRRGLPVARYAQPLDRPVLHYQREWVLAEEHADGPGEESVTTVAIEDRLSGQQVQLQPWYDGEAMTHLNQERAASADRGKTVDEEIHSRRGAARTVRLPMEEDVA